MLTKQVGSDVVSLSAAANEFGVSRLTLRRAADKGRIRTLGSAGTGTSRRIQISRAQLREDLDRLPRCKKPGCPEPDLIGFGYCRTHTQFRTSGKELAVAAHLRTMGGDRDWITAVEARRIAGTTDATIRKAMARGDLPSRKVGRYVQIPRKAFVDWHRNWSARRPRYNSVPRAPDQRDADLRRTLELHERGLSVASISATTGGSLAKVRRDLDALGLTRPRSKRSTTWSSESKDEVVRQCVDLYESGATLREVASAKGISVTSVCRALDSFGVRRRPGGARPLYPPASERACGHCGLTFIPPKPSNADQVYCGRVCANRTKLALLEEELLASGLLGIREASQRLEVSVTRTKQYLESGLLEGRRLAFKSRGHGWGVSEEAIRRFERRWALLTAGADRAAGLRRHWLDPEGAVTHLRANGAITAAVEKRALSSAEAELLERARITRRAKRIARRRAGRKATPLAGRDWTWLEMYEELERELT